MHNVDEFFAKKLRDAEIEPSERAKLLFIEKLEKRKPIVFFEMTAKKWAYLVAASCLFAVIWLGFLKNDNRAEHITKIKLEAKSIFKHDLAFKDVKQTFSEKGTIGKIVRSDLSKVKTLNLWPKKELNIIAVDSNKYVTVPIESSKIEKEVEIRSQTNEVTTTPISKFDTETIVLLSPTNENTKPTVLTSINKVLEKESKRIENEKPLVNRLLAEIIKNDKGKINRLGLLSSEMLAFKEDGFISLESQRIREKLNWIKSKINN